MQVKCKVKKSNSSHLAFSWSNPGQQLSGQIHDEVVCATGTIVAFWAGVRQSSLPPTKSWSVPVCDSATGTLTYKSPSFVVEGRLPSLSLVPVWLLAPVAVVVCGAADLHLVREKSTT